MSHFAGTTYRESTVLLLIVGLIFLPKIISQLKYGCLAVEVTILDNRRHSSLN